MNAPYAGTATTNCPRTRLENRSMAVATSNSLENKVEGLIPIAEIRASVENKDYIGAFAQAQANLDSFTRAIKEIGSTYDNGLFDLMDIYMSTTLFFIKIGMERDEVCDSRFDKLHASYVAFKRLIENPYDSLIIGAIIITPPQLQRQP